jgi:hypothetical protein
MLACTVIVTALGLLARVCSTVVCTVGSGSGSSGSTNEIEDGDGDDVGAGSGVGVGAAVCVCVGSLVATSDVATRGSVRSRHPPTIIIIDANCQTRDAALTVTTLTCERHVAT